MKIKKVLLLFMMIWGAVTVLSVGCSTKAEARKLPKDIPDTARKAVEKVPRDTLIGIGMYEGENPNRARTMAATRARTSIARQLGAMTKEMIHAYQNEGGIDAVTVVTFEEGFTVTLTASTMAGAVVIFEEQDERGNYWVVVMLRKDEAFNEIVRSQNAVKSAEPDFDSFDITNKFDSAFDKAAASEIRVNQ
jgi:hypothetical protein